MVDDEPRWWIDWPMAPSLAAMRSAMTSDGSRSHRASLISVENMAPADAISLRLERSGVAPSASIASRARSIGRANTSPTTVMPVARSRSTSAHTSRGSKPRPSSSTILPPSDMVGVQPMPIPVPCIRGHGTIDPSCAPSAWSRTAAPTAVVAVAAAMPMSGPRPARPARTPVPTSPMTPFGIPVVPPV